MKKWRSKILWHTPLNQFRIQTKVPDPWGSGSNPYFLSIFGNCNKTTLNSVIKKHLSTICHFLFHIKGLQVTQTRTRREITFHLSSLYYFAGSGSGTVIPDPGKSFGSMRIRIHNTGLNTVKKISILDGLFFIGVWRNLTKKDSAESAQCEINKFFYWYSFRTFSETLMKIYNDNFSRNIKS